MSSKWSAPAAATTRGSGALPSWGARPPIISPATAPSADSPSTCRARTGQDLVRRLAARADVLVENFKAGTMEAWGLGYESLAARNPGLIYCAILGYNRDGPHRERPGYDFIAQAMGGIMSVTGEPEGEPMKVGVAIVDVTAGLYATIGILAALQGRSASGRGQRVDVNLLDAAAGWLVNVAANYLASGIPPGRFGNAHPNIVPYQVFAAADGHVAVAVGNDTQWLRLCAAIERPDLAADARYAINSGRLEHRVELEAELAATFATRPVDAWVECIEEAGVPVGPINTVNRVFETPGLLSPSMLAALPHPTAGTVRVVGTPIALSETPAQPRSAPPTLGQHTDEVLRDWLGLDAAEIAALHDSEVI